MECVWATGYADLRGWHLLLALRILRIEVVVDLTKVGDKKHRSILGIDWSNVLKSHGIEVIDLPDLAENPHESLELVRFVKDRRVLLLSPKVNFEGSSRIKVFKVLCKEIEGLVCIEALNVEKVHHELMVMRTLVGEKNSVEPDPLKKAIKEAKEEEKKTTKKKKKKQNKEALEVIEGDAAMELWKQSHKKKKKQRWRKR